MLVLKRKFLLLGFFVFATVIHAAAQLFMTNVLGRKTTSLNGKWHVVIDPLDAGSGDWAAYYKDKKPTSNTDFVEYSFDQGPLFNVPGDFNSQLPELTYFESSVWYKKPFSYVKKEHTRLFVYFGAVNYKAEVYLNGTKVGTHEGGFTPFQFELTDLVKDGSNSLIVKANSARVKNGIPGSGFDWFNYGGITRDVNLIETPENFIEHYFIQTKKDNPKVIAGSVQLSQKSAQQITLQIPELHIRKIITTGADGVAYFSFAATPQLWSPDSPKTYEVKFQMGTDSITERIGFRTIQTRGTDILLNGKPIFLKGVNIHEEIPQRRARAYSESDALQLLTWAKELGCNFVRLVHYPHNEHMVQLAEKLGILVWDEIPVYQGIAFADTATQPKMRHMLAEMIARDKNRCNVIFWSLANETAPTQERTEALKNLIQTARSLDSTRLLTCAFNNIKYTGDTARFTDSLGALLDVISVNEYLGWYQKWPKTPGVFTWQSDFNKPMVMSEFGGEALFGNDDARDSIASTWSEGYQEKIFRDQFAMLKKIPFLRGTCPWVLADFRSPGRNHPKYQNGWNRKGLLSDRGDKKRAWYVVHDFYKSF